MGKETLAIGKVTLTYVEGVMVKTATMSTTDDVTALLQQVAATLSVKKTTDSIKCRCILFTMQAKLSVPIRYNYDVRDACLSVFMTHANVPLPQELLDML